MEPETETRTETPPPKDLSAPEPGGMGKPLSPMQVFWYSIANLGCGAFFSFNNAAIPLFLEDYTKSAVLQGLMASSHSVEGAVIQPIVGTWSDRLRTRMGRRRPFMLIFVPLTALLLALTPPASHLPAGIRLGAIVLSIFLFTVFFNIAFDPYQALMPDITPVRQRGRVTSFWALLGVLGQAGILLLPLPLPIKFYIVAGLILVTTLLTCAMTREPHPDTLTAVHQSHLAEIKEAIRGLKTLRQASRGLMVFFLSGIGIGAVLPYLTKFVKHITHCSNQQAMNMFFVLMITTAASVLPFGKLTDKVGSKRVLFLALALIGVAALNGLWITTIPQIAVVLVIAGLGNAAQSAASYPLITQLVPAQEVGFYTGLQTMALSLLQPATVVVTGLVLEHGHYRFIFGLLAVTMFLGLAVLRSVHQDAADREIAERDRAMGRTSQESLSDGAGAQA